MQAFCCMKDDPALAGWANYKGKTANGILNTKELDTVSSEWLTTYKDKTLSEIGYCIYGDILYIMQGYDLIEGY